MVRRGAKRPENQVRRFPPGRRGTMCITPLASPIHGGGGPRKRWKGLASGDNESYSFLHHSGGTPFGGWRHHLCPGGKHVTGFSGRLTAPYESSSFATPCSGALWTLGISVNLRVEQQRKKNHTTGPSARGNAPLLPPSAASPQGGGDFSGAMPCDAYGVIVFLRFYSVP